VEISEPPKRFVLVSAALFQLAAAATPAPKLAIDVAGDCTKGTADQIVVCGTRTGRSPYRLPILSDTYARKRIRAESDAIPGVHTFAHVESERRPDGSIDKRLMVTFSLPF
jgi:hypothetical protein